jgi:hypothetical protein
MKSIASLVEQASEAMMMATPVALGNHLACPLLTLAAIYIDGDCRERQFLPHRKRRLHQPAGSAIASHYRKPSLR